MRWARGIIVVAALALLYVLVVRPLRGAMVRDSIYPEALAAANHKAGIEISPPSVSGFEVTVGKAGGHSTVFIYFTAFGEYLFIPFMLLAIIRADKKWALLVLIFHGAYFLVDTGLLFLGLFSSHLFLRGMDLLSYILFPASFGIVALAWFESREKNRRQSAHDGPALR